MVNQLMRQMIIPKTRRTIGIAQSECRKVRSMMAEESGCGATQPGISLAMPNCLAAGDCTKYWL